MMHELTRISGFIGSHLANRLEDKVYTRDIFNSDS
jgi:nucleoside-diphosphate-sugar epimerase